MQVEKAQKILTETIHETWSQHTDARQRPDGRSNPLRSPRRSSGENPHLPPAAEPLSRESTKLSRAPRRSSLEKPELPRALRQLAEEKTKLPQTLREMSGEFEKDDQGLRSSSKCFLLRKTKSAVGNNDFPDREHTFCFSGR